MLASLIFHPLPPVHRSLFPSTIFRPSVRPFVSCNLEQRKHPIRISYATPSSPPPPSPCIQTTRLGKPPLWKTRRKVGRGLEGRGTDGSIVYVPAPLCLRCENEIIDIRAGGRKGGIAMVDRMVGPGEQFLSPTSTWSTWFNFIDPRAEEGIKVERGGRSFALFNGGVENWKGGHSWTFLFVFPFQVFISRVCIRHQRESF